MMSIWKCWCLFLVLDEYTEMLVFIFSNIDTGELCEYFSNHLGEMKEIYSLMEDLNHKVTSVLQSTAKVSINIS
jgi:hypothetical protein